MTSYPQPGFGSSLNQDASVDNLEKRRAAASSGQSLRRVWEELDTTIVRPHESAVGADAMPISGSVQSPLSPLDRAMAEILHEIRAKDNS